MSGQNYKAELIGVFGHPKRPHRDAVVEQHGDSAEEVSLAEPAAEDLAAALLVEPLHGAGVNDVKILDVGLALDKQEAILGIVNQGQLIGQRFEGAPVEK